jgi:hypothetical protein
VNPQILAIRSVYVQKKPKTLISTRQIFGVLEDVKSSQVSDRGEQRLSFGLLACKAEA